MTESEVETVVLSTVRRFASDDGIVAKARFKEDLHMSELGRQSLFAYLVEAFNAKGVSLPSRGFFLSAFMPCTSPADVQSAISRLFDKPKGAAGAGAKPQAATSTVANSAVAAAPDGAKKGSKPKKARRSRSRKAR